MWLEDVMDRHPDTRVIVVDTWVKLKPENKGRMSAYEADSKHLGALQHFAHKHGVAVVVVHHIGKQPTSDAFGKINGSKGLIGVADAILVLERQKRTEAGATLHATGRDLESQEQAITFNRDTKRWECDTLAVLSQQATEAQQQVLQVLTRHGRLKPAEIARHIGRDSVRMLLSRMAGRGLVDRDDAGRYGVPTPPTPSMSSPPEAPPQPMEPTPTPPPAQPAMAGVSGFSRHELPPDEDPPPAFALDDLVAELPPPDPWQASPEYACGGYAMSS